MRFPVLWLVRATIFRHFCGGETIADCKVTIDRLAQYNVGTILDYSVEGNGSEEAFDATTAEILRTVDVAAQNPHVPFSVFKVSGLARFDLLAKVSENGKLSESESDEWKKVHDRIARICQRAADRRVRVFIDAEESWIQTAVDHLAEEMMERHNRERAVVYTTVQMCRTDRLAYLRSLLERTTVYLGLKVVRGAYVDKERARAARLGLASPVHFNKAATDRDYDAALEYCLDHADRVSVCVATHNEASTSRMILSLERRGLSPHDSRFYFAQLLGMSDHISYNLSYCGYPVAKYVPYGPVRSVMPYLFRRAKENTSIQGQTSRELTLLTREVSRRRLSSPPPG